MVKTTRSEGTVAWFNPALGYGFLDTADKGQIFVHYTALNQDGYKKLQKDQKVTFILTPTDKGDQAQEVEVLEDSSEVNVTEEKQEDTQNEVVAEEQKA